MQSRIKHEIRFRQLSTYKQQKKTTGTEVSVWACSRCEAANGERYKKKKKKRNCDKNIKIPDNTGKRLGIGGSPSQVSSTAVLEN